MQLFVSYRKWLVGTIVTSIITLTGYTLPAQERPAYAIFSGDGKPVKYRKMIKALSEADVVFFGELHNNSVAHWLELQVLKDLHSVRSEVVLGMEMFEADNQLVLDEYLRGIIDEKSFLNEARLWDNYKTDYKPLVEFARKNDLPVIATNVPRRYANLVYRKGPDALDSLSNKTREWMTPLPLEVDYDLPGYKAMIEGMGQHGSGSAKNLVAAQALKDATMAHFINMHHSPGSAFYHINGAYHSKDHEGIIFYLTKINPDLTIITLHTVEQADLEDLDDDAQNSGDFIICIPDDMTKTY